MKSKQFISLPLTPFYTFKHEDITNLLFYDKAPAVTAPLFSNRPAAVTFEIRIPSEEEQHINSFILHKCIKLKQPSNLPTWVFFRIVEMYHKYLDAWMSYLLQEMHQFCKTNSLSFLKWGSYKQQPSTINYQGLPFLLWVYSNQAIEENRHQEFMIEIKESLLPWINNKLYSEVVKKKESTRFNVEYEQQKQELALSAIPTIKPLQPGVTDEFDEQLDWIL